MPCRSTLTERYMPLVGNCGTGCMAGIERSRFFTIRICSAGTFAMGRAGLPSREERAQKGDLTDGAHGWLLEIISPGEHRTGFIVTVQKGLSPHPDRTRREPR